LKICFQIQLAPLHPAATAAAIAAAAEDRISDAVFAVFSGTMSDDSDEIGRCKLNR